MEMETSPGAETILHWFAPRPILNKVSHVTTTIPRKTSPRSKDTRQSLKPADDEIGERQVVCWA
jgi:hypothetical protein